MKKYQIALLSVLLISILPGCGKESGDQTNGNNYEQISQEEAKKLMDSEKDCIILDVRTEEEYEEGHIPGAMCIPNEIIEESISSLIPDKNSLILVYCRSGNRSKQASEKLGNLGYNNIKEFGGINDWPYETTTDASENAQ